MKKQNFLLIIVGNLFAIYAYAWVMILETLVDWPRPAWFMFHSELIYPLAGLLLAITSILFWWLKPKPAPYVQMFIAGTALLCALLSLYIQFGTLQIYSYPPAIPSFAELRDGLAPILLVLLVFGSAALLFCHSLFLAVRRSAS